MYGVHDESALVILPIPRKSKNSTRRGVHHSSRLGSARRGSSGLGRDEKSVGARDHRERRRGRGYRDVKGERDTGRVDVDDDVHVEQCAWVDY